MSAQTTIDLNRSGIYQIVNTINGKRYVGSAKSFNVRWTKHRGDLRLGRHHSAYLQRSWDTHGADAFKFEVVEFWDAPDLIPREQMWLDVAKPAYNVSPTAANCLGVKHSEATKLKHSLNRTGKKASPETVAKRTGQKRTPEQRARYSAAQRLAWDSLSPEEKKLRSEKRAAAARRTHTGRKQSAEERAMRSAASMGRVVSEETRQKISAANKGRPPPPQAIAASRAATKGVKKSEEFCQKLRGRKMSEETKQKISEAHKGKKRTPEHQAKLAAALRGRKLPPEAIAKRTATRRANGNYGLIPSNER